MSDFQLFAVLDPATEAALRASIERFGVLVPVAKDQHGRIIDGYHRSRIADELGRDYRVDTHHVADDDEAREMARTLNADRRHLSVEQRKEVAATLREQGHSLRAIAGALGVSDGTVRADLSTAQDYAVPERVTGLDGKSRPARRSVVAAKSQREAERAQEALSLIQEPPRGVLDVKRVERIAREQAAERRRNEPSEPSTTHGEIEIYHGDFREALAEADVIGAVIVTDPPYPREFLNDWADLAQCGLEWGCEGLIAMAGQSILPDALELILRAARPPIDEYIDWQRWRYRWCCSYLTIGPSTRVWHAKVGTSWKPILVFDLEGEERSFLTTDVFRPTGDDKRYHPWGQNEAGIAALVEAFTEPGDTVVDPFLGGGTTAVVCQALGRRFVGCDIDAATVETTRRRLAA